MLSSLLCTLVSGLASTHCPAKIKRKRGNKFEINYLLLPNKRHRNKDYLMVAEKTVSKQIKKLQG